MNNKTKRRPQREKPEFKDEMARIREKMRRQTEDVTLYSVMSKPPIDGIHSLKEARRISGETKGSIWACFQEGEDYIRAYPII